MSGYKGMVKKFPVNRPLTDQDRKYHLEQGKRLDLKPYPDLMVVRLNSTYVEIVDKFFQEKGFIFLLVLTFFFVFVVGGVFVVFDVLDAVINGERFKGYILHGTFQAALLIAVGLGIAWFCRFEWRGYTYYPIRLNYKTQMVHVFRKDGSVLSVPWSELYFTLDYDFSYFKHWEIHAHVLAEDRETVLETFVMGTSGDVDPGGLPVLHAHWEFFRRYMEEGPESVAGYVKFAMPVENRREPFRSGYEVIMSAIRHPHPLVDVLRFVTWPLFFLQSVARWIAMRTCKLPSWPAEIKAVNVVADDDPICIDSRINPPELR